jgi:cysteine desulfurase
MTTFTNALADSVAVVLVDTSHPGNIGAVARAMKNMGLYSLRLVRPQRFPDAEATARASGADDLLAQARVFDRLDDAIGDATLVLGASGRQRSLTWPQMTAREAATEVIAGLSVAQAPKPVLEAGAEGGSALADDSTAPRQLCCILFGTEKTGLSNVELDRCHRLLSIPASDAYSSLNLAMAVQVVCYELRIAALAADEAGAGGIPPAVCATAAPDPRGAPAATAAQMEALYAHYERTLLATGFLNPDNPRHLMRRLRRLYGRAALDQNEMQILRGVLSSVDDCLSGRRPARTPAAGGTGASTVIYLDYAATTPVDPAVAAVMQRCLREHWANPSSAHDPGREAAQVVARARRRVAECLACASDEVVFTGGATESINTAILGAARFSASRGRHVVTTRIEHRATLGACEQLAREGFDVTQLAPDSGGLLSPDALEAALREDTVLVTLTHVNSELGTILDLDAVAALCEKRGVALHIDAAQSAGKLPIDLRKLSGVSFMSLSAHKIYGPKGAGVLFVRRHPRRALLAPIMSGGGQEHGIRAGSLATHQIAGLGEALHLASQRREQEQRRLGALRDQLWAALKALGDVHLNGDGQRKVAGHLNVAFGGVDGESLLLALPDLAVSRGSACASLQGEPSYVLRALGRDDRLAGASLRLTLGRQTTAEHVEIAAERIGAAVRRLRALSPCA